MLTHEQKAKAESFFVIQNEGMTYSDRMNIFLSVTFLLDGKAKNPVEYKKAKIKKFGIVWEHYYSTAYETMSNHTCLADWYDRVDKIASQKMGVLSTLEARPIMR